MVPFFSMEDEFEESEMEPALREQDERLAQIIAMLPSVDDADDAFQPSVHVESRGSSRRSAKIKRTFVLLRQGDRQRSNVPRGHALTSLIADGRQATLEFRKNISSTQLLALLKKTISRSEVSIPI